MPNAVRPLPEPLSAIREGAGRERGSSVWVPTPANLVLSWAKKCVQRGLGVIESWLLIAFANKLCSPHVCIMLYFMISYCSRVFIKAFFKFTLLLSCRYPRGWWKGPTGLISTKSILDFVHFVNRRKSFG